MWSPLVARPYERHAFRPDSWAACPPLARADTDGSLDRPVRQKASLIAVAGTQGPAQKRSYESTRQARRRFSVIIADRNPLFLQGLKSVLQAEPEFLTVAICQTTAACIAAIRRLTPDLAIIETGLPGAGGIFVLATIAANRLPTRTLLLSSIAEMDQSAQAFAMGAYGILPREIAPQSLVRRLRQVAGGQKLVTVPAEGPQAASGQDEGLRRDPEKSLVAITSREQQIINLVALGLSNKQIGLRLDISESTVKTHLNHIFQKLAIRHRSSLPALWRARSATFRPPET